MKRKIYSTVIALALALSSTNVSAGALDGMCIGLIHGILGFDDTNGLAGGLVKYWGGLDGYLRSQGAKVTTPGSSAMNDIPTRSSQTKSQLDTFMAANGCTKIHLIGHSQGGLVSRYIVKNLAYSSKTATVTTVNSLHKGAPMADIILAVLPNWILDYVNDAGSLLGKLLYRDGRPQDVKAMAKSLTVDYVKNVFNPGSPNVSGMKYYSYGSKMTVDIVQHPLMSPTHPITWAGGKFYGLGGDNDGVVPYTSQSWGTWKGSPTAYWGAKGIDHLQATNFEWGGQNYYDVQGYYLKIAQNAKAGL